MAQDYHAGGPGQADLRYNPASLNFINRPNPVEPQSVPQKHPLDPRTPQLASKTPADPDLLRLLRDGHPVGGSVDGPDGEGSKGKGLDLPKLPVRQSAKRMRIPPTLSGLYEPPPNAGLLPSISTEQPAQAHQRAQASETSHTGDETSNSPANDANGGTAQCVKTTKARLKRNRWSDEETAFLLKGVARFGIGSWTKILRCEDYRFDRRSALDLKDRFRVCCPDEYQSTTTGRLGSNEPSRLTAHAGGVANVKDTPDTSASKSASVLHELGIDKPLQKTKRRKRTAYSSAEDEALLQGFRKYGNAWAAIRSDRDLGLEKRTATDLRDRMRTKYPSEYAKIGLAPRPEIFPKPARRGNEDEPPQQQDEAYRASDQSSHRAGKENQYPTVTLHAHLQAQKSTHSSMPRYDALLFDASFDSDVEAERITLDRGILDWPADHTRPGVYDSGRSGGGIDPLATLKLPKPSASLPAPSGSSNMNGALPSVAAITAFNGMDAGDDLELPSLMLGALDGDGRSGGQILGLDEMLS